MEGTVFQQSDEAASEAQEICRAQRKLLQELVQLADGAEFGRNVQQLVEFVSPRPGRTVEFRVGDGHRRKTGDHGNQRFFFRAENPLRARIDQDRALRLGSAKGRGNQHPGRNQFAQGVRRGINGHADGLARRHRPAGQIGGKLQSPAIMPGPHRSGQLHRLGGDRPQAEAGRFLQHHADQAGAQQDPKPVRHGFDDRRRLGCGMDSLRDLSQNLGAPVFLPGNLGEAAGLEQAAQLSRQDGGFGGQVGVEEVGIGTMQKDCRADRIVAHHQRSRHDRARVVLGGHEIAGRIQLIFVHGFLLPDGFGRNGYRTLAGLYPRPRKAVCHHAIGLCSQQFVGGHPLPEIGAIDLKKFPSGLTKQPD